MLSPLQLALAALENDSKVPLSVKRWAALMSSLPNPLGDVLTFAVPPTTGSYRVGQPIWNSNATPTSSPGWVCVGTAPLRWAAMLALGGVPVTPTGPVNTIPPVVTGNAQEGNLLTSTTGTWSGTPTIAYTYQWQLDGVNIAAATASTYTTLLAQVGHVVSCVVTGTSTYGANNGNSNGITVTSAAPVATALAWATQPPPTALAGAVLSPFPAIQVVDQNGNAIADVVSVTMTPTGGTFTGGSTTSGNTDASGHIYFSNLAVTAASTVTMVASAGGLTSSPASSNVVVSAVAAPAATGTAKNGGTYDPALVASDYSKLDLIIVDLNSTRAPADLPGKRVLFYRSLLSCNTGYDTSIPWATANANNWLAKDSGGNLLINAGFPSNNIIDPSSTAAATALGNNFVTWCRTYGFTGVWCDDVVGFCTELCNALPNGMSQAQWHTNVIAQARRVAQIVEAAGLEFTCNASDFTPGNSGSDDGSLNATFWTAIGAVASGSQSPPTGFTSEYWEETADGNNTPRTIGAVYNQHWDGWRALHATCHTLGVAFMPLTYCSAPDDAVCKYARGTFLLDYNGDRSVCLIGPPGSPAWGSVWAKNEGSIGSAATQTGQVWNRSFGSGTVAVNSTVASATLT